MAGLWVWYLGLLTKSAGRLFVQIMKRVGPAHVPRRPSSAFDDCLAAHGLLLVQGNSGPFSREGYGLHLHDFGGQFGGYVRNCITNEICHVFDELEHIVDP